MTPIRQREPRRTNDKYLRAVSLLPSIISGRYGVQVCHIRYADERYGKRQTGMGEKPDDMWVLPMCPQEHAKQHMQNERVFWSNLGIDATAEAFELYRCWLTAGAFGIQVRINTLLIYR